MDHDKDFLDVGEVYENVAGDLLEGNVDLVLVDPPNNVRKERSNDNSLPDIFTPEDMRGIGELARQLMAAGTHGNVLCSCMQFPNWYNRLVSTQKKVPNFETESEVEVIMGRAICEVESIPLHRTQAYGSYYNDLLEKELSHAPVVEIACHS